MNEDYTTLANSYMLVKKTLADTTAKKVEHISSHRGKIIKTYY